MADDKKKQLEKGKKKDEVKAPEIKPYDFKELLKTKQLADESWVYMIHELTGKHQSGDYKNKDDLHKHIKDVTYNASAKTLSYFTGSEIKADDDYKKAFIESAVGYNSEQVSKKILQELETKNWEKGKIGKEEILAVGGQTDKFVEKSINTYAPTISDEKIDPLILGASRIGVNPKDLGNLVNGLKKGDMDKNTFKANLLYNAYRYI